MPRVNLSVAGAAPRSVPAGTPAVEVLPPTAPNGLPVLAACFNNDVVTLRQPLSVNGTLDPLTLADVHGWRVYRWSLTFLLGMAMHEVFPGRVFRVRHPIGGGLFCSVDWRPEQAADIAGAVARIETRMRERVRDDLPVACIQVAYAEAIANLRANRQLDQLHLLAYRNPPQVTLMRCGDYLDMRHEPLIHRTGLLDRFALTPYESGFVLRLPAQEAPDRVAPFNPQPHLIRIYQEHISWGRILGITTVGELNEAIATRRAGEVIETVEALHNKKLARIADQIGGQPSRPRLVLIAGPSSSGKTTMAKRLMTHLRVNGCQPFMISTDDYFVGDALNPRDEQGNLDYEHLHALDLPRLNRDLNDLLAGRPVHLPRFNFHTRSREERPDAVSLGGDSVILIEGIHALNPELTAQVPRGDKFLIYISALTQLAIDFNSRISTTDNRLLRRMVRDNQFRKHPPLQTLRRWPSVLRGEAHWIFPYQHLADAVFNSALDYELAILKPFAAALLNEIKPTDPEYAEARRLSGILHCFVALAHDDVPGDSILREYIGGSRLDY
ncbi:MAG: nucleoside kinase [Lentisphaerae bacterium]|nr:nucleoside kinase [Lentisphaerota bacterium]